MKNQIKEPSITKEMIESILTLNEVWENGLHLYSNPITKKEFKISYNENNSVKSIGFMQWIHNHTTHFYEYCTKTIYDASTFEEVKQIIK